MNFFKSREKIRAFILYAALTACLFAPVAFMGKSLQPSLLQPYGMVDGWPYGYEGRTPEPIFNIDMATAAYYEWPINKFIGESYKNLELPIWNPFQGLGLPLAAQYSSRSFFPYQILENISPVWLWDYFLLGRPLLAGFFTFLFLRLFGLQFSFAFLGGTLYMFSGAFTWFINLEQYANCALMVPVHLFALERFIRSRTSFNLALAGCSFALVLVAGQPEIALIILLLGMFFFFFSASQYGLLKNTIFYSIITLLGFLLAAPLLLPFLELMRNSFHLHPPGGLMGVNMGMRNFVNIFEGAQIFTPNALSIHQATSTFVETWLSPDGEPFYFRIFPLNGAWDYTGGYTGIISFFLIATALIYSLKQKHEFRRYLIFFSAFAFVIILKNFGFRPFLWLGRLPLLDMVWTQRWAGPVWIFCIAVAAAFACQIIKNNFENGLPRIRQYFIVLTGALATLAVYLAFVYVLAHLPLPNFGMVESVMLQLERSPTPLPTLVIESALTVLFLTMAVVTVLVGVKKESFAGGTLPLAILELWWGIPMPYDHDWLYFKLIPLFSGFIALCMFLCRKNRAGFAFSVMALLAFMTIDGLSTKGLPHRYNPFKPAPYIDFLKEKASFERLMGGYGMLFPNFSSAAKLFDIRYITALTPDAFHAFKTSYLQEENSNVNMLWFTGQKYIKTSPEQVNLTKISFEDDFFQNLQYYSFLGVKHLVLPPYTDINQAARNFTENTGVPLPSFAKIYSGADATIFENPMAFPRAYTVNSVQFAPSGNALQLLEHIDLRNTVIIDEQLELAPVSQPVRGKTEILEYRNNLVRIKTNNAGASLVVLTDLFYPGWKAYVNGKPAKIYRANGIVRGVYVPEGQHEIVFKYRPASFAAGCVLFLAGAFLILYLVAGKRLRSFITTGQ